MDSKNIFIVGAMGSGKSSPVAVPSVSLFEPLPSPIVFTSASYGDPLHTSELHLAAMRAHSAEMNKAVTQLTISILGMQSPRDQKSCDSFNSGRCRPMPGK